MKQTTAKELIKLLESEGFTLLHQKGSHKKYVKDNVFAIVVYHGNAKETMSPGVVKTVKQQILKAKENGKKENISTSNSSLS